MKWPGCWDGIYGCQSINADVKGLWLRAGVKTWTPLPLQPSQERTRPSSVTANSPSYSSVTVFPPCLSICVCLLFFFFPICICMSCNSPRTLNLCIRYLASAAFSLTSQAAKQERFGSCLHDNLKTWKPFHFFWHPSKISTSFILQRFWAHCHSNTSCCLLGSVTSLPGGAGGWVHCKEQAGDADLPLHPGHTDLLQVQWRMGSPGWPLDWADCWSGHR